MTKSGTAAPTKPPLAEGMTSGVQATQVWGEDSRIDAGVYIAERITFTSQGEQVVANIFLPKTSGQNPAIVLLGPVGTVKEQSVIQYATRLARMGFITLIFDPRTMGESAGEPRRNESGSSKVQDLNAAIEYLATRREVNAARLFIVGLCQGANWAVETALINPSVGGVALVAGH